jgi:hypothetical protein
MIEEFMFIIKEQKKPRLVAGLNSQARRAIDSPPDTKIKDW